MIVANHLDMGKFDNAQNPGYLSFRAALSDYLEPLRARITEPQRKGEDRLMKGP
jgi:hypothetical protein